MPATVPHSFAEVKIYFRANAMMCVFIVLLTMVITTGLAVSHRYFFTNLPFLIISIISHLLSFFLAVPEMAIPLAMISIMPVNPDPDGSASPSIRPKIIENTILL